MGKTFYDLSCEELCDLMCGNPEEDFEVEYMGRGSSKAGGNKGVAFKTDSNDIGQRVTIKSKDSWLNGEWGVIKAVDADGNYYVAPYGAENESLIFTRDELRFKRKGNK